MERRRILGFATLVMAAALLFSAATPGLGAEPVKRDDAASEKIGLRLSMQCWSYNNLSFFECVDKAASMGIKYVEMYPGQRLKPGSEEKVSKTMPEAVCQEVLKKLDEKGVKLVAYGVDGIATDEAGARKEFEWAKKMGIKVIVTETMPNDVLDKLTGEYDIRFALHNHPQSWPPAEVLRACQGKGKLVGSCSDTGHWLTRGWLPAEMAKEIEGRVLHSHLKDRDEIGKGHDVPFGSGKGNIAGFMAELKRQGFNGYLSIEYEYGDVKLKDDALPKCVEFFDKTCAELAK